ncbi:hypothetical protein BN2537_11855 [Streptomyces venezuelae]|nr:hypothetical protein BN2537_11855 [Streptomyces venezuelae]
MLVLRARRNDSGHVAARQVLQTASQLLTQSDQDRKPIQGHPVILDLVDPVL